MRKVKNAHLSLEYWNIAWVTESCSVYLSFYICVLRVFLVHAVLKDAGKCKTDDHDSEDEELPDDEIDSK